MRLAEAALARAGAAFTSVSRVPSAVLRAFKVQQLTPPVELLNESLKAAVSSEDWDGGRQLVQSIAYVLR